MGIIFSDKAKKVKINELLGTDKEIILSRLQAGRIKTENGSAPYRLSKDELIKLSNEYIYYEVDSNCYYARFEKSANEIREILGLPRQSDNPFCCI